MFTNMKGMHTHTHVKVLRKYAVSFSHLEEEEEEKKEGKICEMFSKSTNTFNLFFQRTHNK